MLAVVSANAGRIGSHSRGIRLCGCLLGRLVLPCRTRLCSFTQTCVHVMRKGRALSAWTRSTKMGCICGMARKSVCVFSACIGIHTFGRVVSSQSKAFGNGRLLDGVSADSRFFCKAFRACNGVCSVPVCVVRFFSHEPCFDSKSADGQCLNAAISGRAAKCARLPEPCCLSVRSDFGS